MSEEDDFDKAAAEVEEQNMFDQRYELNTVLSNMPFGGSLEPPPRYDQGDDLIYLSKVTAWLGLYSQLVATHKTAAANRAAEHTELLSQRSAIRAFLGLTKGDS